MKKKKNIGKKFGSVDKGQQKSKEEREGGKSGIIQRMFQ